MKERPILFSGAMVRALLAGTKTQTRRVKGLENANAMPWLFVDAPRLVTENGSVFAEWALDDDGIERVSRYKCPYGQPVDRLWVREAWRTTGDGGRCNDMPPRQIQPLEVWYEADGTAPANECTGKLRPSMFMPRWASRIMLEITAVRVERLKDISEADAISEGTEPYRLPCHPAREALRHVDGFSALWESINGPGSWSANPWVWVVEFRRVA